MKPIQIDMAPRSVKRALARTRPATLLLACGGLFLCTGALVTALELKQQLDALQAERNSMESQLADRLAPKPVQNRFIISEAQAGAVNGAIAQLNLPWRHVFDALETATPATIALLSLEPDAKKKMVRGLAEAKGSDGMIAYIEQLKQLPFFGAVVLTRHEINEQDPNKPIRFQFEAQWIEGAQ